VRSIGLVAAVGALALMVAGGCGYLPSELAPPEKKDEEQEKPAPRARIVAKQHTASCAAPARGFRRVQFDSLYATTGDPDRPFREADDLPAQFDVSAYVWGFDDCMRAGTCEGGDHYWLIGRGPRDDFTTWVVTPQFPRITIQSTCRERLKVGERYRFSFSRGQLVGFSR